MKRLDLAVTTSQKPGEALRARAAAIAEELNCGLVERYKENYTTLFERNPGIERLVVVQTERLLLVAREGWEFFYHPNLGHMRLGNLLRGQLDYLIESTQLQPGDSLLDCTLGYAAEATLCAHVVGPTGEVHGVEAVPELGLVVREGLKVFPTSYKALVTAMRRVQVVHLGSHLEYLRLCPDKRYDIVYFDPFFDVAVDHQETLGPLKAFGERAPLQPEAVHEALRVARRAVVIKTARWSPLLEALGVTELHGGRTAKVVYGVVRPL